MRRILLLLPVFAILAVTAFAEAQSVSGNAAVHFKKDLTGLFIVTVKDPDGIKEFWLTPKGKGRYGGEIDCPRVFVNNTVQLEDPGDFTPTLGVYVVDCRGNRENFVADPPQNGVTFGRAEEKAEEAPRAKTEAAAISEARQPAAEEPAKPTAVTAPVPELGNCASEDECRAYCDDPDNMEACVAYAERTNRLSAEEISRAKKFLEVKKSGGGPGGCTTPDGCMSYCEDIAHIDQCLAFAEENNFLSGEELADVRRAAKAKRDGIAFPGGCSSKSSCEAYCENGEHIDECLAFAEQSGFLPPEELAEVRRFAPLMRKGETPGQCKSKKSCESYCEVEGHFDECVAFAEKAGLMTATEASAIRESGGKGPGGCKSKTQCETYCNDPAHLDECVDFGIRAGLVKPEEAEMVRKAGGKGPGDCRSKESCEAYCADPAHGEECLDFGLRAGFIKPEEADIVRKAGGKLPGGCRGFAECQAYCTDPAHQSECASLIEAAGIKIPEEVGMPGGMGGGGRGELFEQERQRHIQRVQQEDPNILECLKSKVGEEVFLRRQSGRLQNEGEALRVEETLRSCNATLVQRWQEIIKVAQSERPADYVCVVSKLGQGVVDRILGGEEVAGSSWVIESECRFLPSTGGTPADIIKQVLPAVQRGETPDVDAIKRQIEEQYKAQIPEVPPGYEAKYERQKQLIEEQYRQQFQQFQQQYPPYQAPSF